MAAFFLPRRPGRITQRKTEGVFASRKQCYRNSKRAEFASCSSRQGRNVGSNMLSPYGHCPVGTKQMINTSYMGRMMLRPYGALRFRCYPTCYQYLVPKGTICACSILTHTFCHESCSTGACLWLVPVIGGLSYPTGLTERPCGWRTRRKRPLCFRFQRRRVPVGRPCWEKK